MDAVERSARREQRRREIRRRRTIALGSLAVVLALVVAIAAIASGGSGGSTGSHASGAAAGGHPQDAPARASSGGGTVTSTVRSTATGAPGTTPVPILMYHVIAAPPAGAPFPGLYVEPQLFAEQMQALEDAGWHAVTPDQMEAYWRHGTPLGNGKPIVLSFDNGYQSQYTQALPVLKRLGWVGEENIQLSGLPPSQGGLLQRQIRGLVQAGWELDTQGYDHADLITLDPQQLAFQVATTRRTIQQRFHVPVNWFCYPSGHYDPTVVEAVKAAGYTGSTTVVPGWAHHDDDPYRLHRLRVLGGTSPQALLTQIEDARAEPPAPASYSG